MDIHNSIYGYPKKDILKSNYGYPKIKLWISKNQQYKFKDILKYIIGYPKIMLNIGYPKMYFVISINRIMDILNSIFFLDIHKSNYGYP